MSPTQTASVHSSEQHDYLQFMLKQPYAWEKRSVPDVGVLYVPMAGATKMGRSAGFSAEDLAKVHQHLPLFMEQIMSRESWSVDRITWNHMQILLAYLTEGPWPVVPAEAKFFKGAANGVTESIIREVSSLQVFPDRRKYISMAVRAFTMGTTPCGLRYPTGIAAYIIDIRKKWLSQNDCDWHKNYTTGVALGMLPEDLAQYTLASPKMAPTGTILPDLAL